MEQFKIADKRQPVHSPVLHSNQKRTLQEQIALKKQLYQAYVTEEKILLNYEKLYRKYNALSQSRLGKLTLFYWKLRNKRRRKKREN